MKRTIFFLAFVVLFVSTEARPGLKALFNEMLYALAIPFESPLTIEQEADLEKIQKYHTFVKNMHKKQSQSLSGGILLDYVLIRSEHIANRSDALKVGRLFEKIQRLERKISRLPIYFGNLEIPKEQEADRKTWEKMHIHLQQNLEYTRVRQRLENIVDLLIVFLPYIKIAKKVSPLIKEKISEKYFEERKRLAFNVRREKHKFAKNLAMGYAGSSVV